MIEVSSRGFTNPNLNDVQSQQESQQETVAAASSNKKCFFLWRLFTYKKTLSYI